MKQKMISKSRIEKEFEERKKERKIANCKHLVSIMRFIDHTSEKLIIELDLIYTYIYCFHWKNRMFDRNETKNDIEISDRKGTKKARKNRREREVAKHLKN